jgi:hypothetical protein
MHEVHADALIATRWYDRPVRSLTRYLPRLGARLVIRAHRHYVSTRLTPIDLDGVRLAVSPQDNLGHNLFYFGAYEPQQARLWGGATQPRPRPHSPGCWRECRILLAAGRCTPHRRAGCCVRAEPVGRPGPASQCRDEP